jgi:Sensors of blue-light using FAD
MGLCAVSYVSIASDRVAHGPTQDGWLADARAFNASCDVTSVLLHDGVYFLQYMEGAAADVARVYERIQRASDHYGVIQLFSQPIGHRYFPTCALGFARLADAELKAVARAESAHHLQQICAVRGPNPVLKQLLGFWHQARGTV